MNRTFGPPAGFPGACSGMRLESDDQMVGMEVLSHGQTLFAATENGYGKRTSIDEYPVQKTRGAKGLSPSRPRERNGRVVTILLVEEDDDLMLMTNSGKIIRMPIRGSVSSAAIPKGSDS